MTSIVPRSLYITDVKVETRTTIGTGGFGRVFRGEYEGQQVAVKVVDNGHNDVRALPIVLSQTY